MVLKKQQKSPLAQTILGMTFGDDFNIIEKKPKDWIWWVAAVFTILLFIFFLSNPRFFWELIPSFLKFG